jgi:outer membrane lipoprotein SlyB
MAMLKQRGLIGVAVAAALAAAAPAVYAETSHAHYSKVAYIERARVVNIDVVHQGGDRHSSGAGAVIGGIAGGVLGHQFGSGRGNTAATVAGAAGGALAGNEIEKRRNDTGSDRYRITVRFEDGREATFDQPSLEGLRVGDIARVDGDRVYRD